MTDAQRLRQVIHVLIRLFLVSGKSGAPAEGRLPFNPLYFHMLGHLREHGATRPSELATTMELARSTISTASQALASRGLVKKQRDETDGRAHLLALTAEGKEVAAAIYRQDIVNMKLLLDQLDSVEIEPLLVKLEKIISGLGLGGDE
ncbi:MAG: MarR family transcriptional regulator [Pseudomonadota bacterium]